jgi:hypothetical protein
MTNETTASQPKSIGDDAGFLFLMTGITGIDTEGENYKRIVRFIDNFRAPAAQASATIQAAPEYRVGWFWSSANPDKQVRCLAEGKEIAEYEKRGDFIGWCDAATIQEPVMVAEPVGDLMGDIKKAIRLADAVGVSRADNRYARNEKAVEELVDLELSIYRRLAAPMVADPAGVAVPTWQQRIPSPRKEKYCTMNCSGGVRPCEDCGTETIYGDHVAARDAEIADLRAALAATVKAVPSEALDLMKEARELAPILRGMCEGGGEERNVDIYAANYSAGDGDIFVQRAADLLEDFAAPLADKTGGGE